MGPCFRNRSARLRAAAVRIRDGLAAARRQQRVDPPVEQLRDRTRVVVRHERGELARPGRADLGDHDDRAAGEVGAEPRAPAQDILGRHLALAQLLEQAAPQARRLLLARLVERDAGHRRERRQVEHLPRFGRRRRRPGEHRDHPDRLAARVDGGGELDLGRQLRGSGAAARRDMAAHGRKPAPLGAGHDGRDPGRGDHDRDRAPDALGGQHGDALHALAVQHGLDHLLMDLAQQREAGGLAFVGSCRLLGAHRSFITVGGRRGRVFGQRANSPLRPLSSW